MSGHHAKQSTKQGHFNFIVDALNITQHSAGFRGGKGFGSRAFHQRGPQTIFMRLALYATCACHLLIFSKEILFVDAINYRPFALTKPTAIASLHASCAVVDHT